MTIPRPVRTRRSLRPGVFEIVGLLLVSVSFGRPSIAADKLPTQRIIAPPNRAALTDTQWMQVEAAIDAGLLYIAQSQKPDGSFPAPNSGQPGVTSLCVLAFLASGHKPGSSEEDGPYAETLARAIDYTLSKQKRKGMLSVETKGTRPEYNHGISALMLSEVYDMTLGDRRAKIEQAVPKALRFTRSLQEERKRNARDQGGWRYLERWGANDSDMTVSTWQIMFYHSAKNAKFEVPAEYIEEAMGYVHRCFDPERGGFVYALAVDQENYCSGGSVGGGVVNLALAGEQYTKGAEACGLWILDNSFDRYNRRRHPDDRYHYSACFCSIGMFQIGGKAWEAFYPPFQQTLLMHQHENGSWDPESVHDASAGNVYTTALTVLALTPPYQLLPLFRKGKTKGSELSDNPPEPK